MTRNFFGEIDNVILEPYDSRYPEDYKNEVRLLRTELSYLTAVYHHIGSTAIPGMLSKPVIDIAVELSIFPLMPAEISKVESLGYVYWPDNPNKDHQFFFKNLPRTHHLHFYPKGYAKLYDQIKFRDTLCANKELRAEYERLKIELATKYKTDREAYTEAKSEFVSKVLRGK